MDLPFADGAFDFATGFMSLMDVPVTDRVVAEAYRILRPGGFLQFSITHPCVERLVEPRPSDETVRLHPGLQDAQVVAYFLQVRARKPG